MMMDDARDCIAAMIQQEEKHYGCHNNYLQPLLLNTTCSCETSQRALHLLQECAMVVTDVSCLVGQGEPNKLSSSSVPKSPSVVCVQEFEKSNTAATAALQRQEELCCGVCHKPFTPPAPSQQDSMPFWREQMFDWSCMVVDSYGIENRSDVVALGFSILDRYVATESSKGSSSGGSGGKQQVPITRDDFQLFSMTALHIAVKLLCGHNKLTVAALVVMSRGFYTGQDVCVTEHEILTALQWRLHAPTAISFARLMMTDSDDDGEQQQPAWWSQVEHVCTTLTEIAVADAAFVDCKASNVALASVILAARLRGIAEDDIQQFVSNLQGMIQTDHVDFQRTYSQLERAYCS